MKIDVAEVRRCLKSFDFKTLFREHLGWDNHQAQIDIPVNGSVISLSAVAHKRSFVAFLCDSIPDRPTRLKIDHQVTKLAHEHFVIYIDEASGQQVWQWVRRDRGKPLASRDHRFDIRQSGDPLIQRLDQIAVSLEEEEKITLPDVVVRNRAALDVDKVTKKFYDRFKAEHAAFLKLVSGIKADADLQWYTSLMLNRLMFVYFIQKKRFLDNDPDYLRKRMAMVRQTRGKDEFQSFYRYFLLRLFHEGLGQPPDERNLDPAMERLLGKVPHLNGGFFEVHQLEEQNPNLDIPDKAFEKLFDFFDQYSWHLDERPLRTDNEINPDVVGYIFEKYINQKQMGAYYTKEDITEYISKNTIIPFLFDAAERKCAVVFTADSALWRLLRDDPDRYIYQAVRHGVIDETGSILPLPTDIEAGITDVAGRDGWNRPASAPYALPTETWREHVARRQRCLEIREKLGKGEVFRINDLITLNLDIWQFARDAIINAEGPELLRAFWHAIEKVTVLDPTCGSGAFLFAALRILETLYSDCMERMERFIEDIADKPHHPEQYSDFKKVLAQIAKHPNDRYFILKSVIINNLFGVDIMEEAVEICKLRLFLKLVAQVDTVDQIEPLPDIDFNIRAGNTLVGYATVEQARKAFTEGTNVSGQVQGMLMLGDKADAFKRFEESVELVDRAFQQFRAQQTTYGGTVTHGDKLELRSRLEKLDSELDRYLAKEYGVRVEKAKDFEAWKASHQPFHWFVEFYGIMHQGGFDVIIGNPPYVELTKVSRMYTPKGFETEGCGNLYALCAERSQQTLHHQGRFGFIVQQPITSTVRMGSCRAFLSMSSSSIWSATFDDRPSKLFDGMHHARLAIVLSQRSIVTDQHAALFVSKYNRWYKEERSILFSRLGFVGVKADALSGIFPKIETPTELGLVEKLTSHQKLFGSWLAEHPPTDCRLFYKITGVGNWFTITDRPPRFFRDNGQSSSTREAEMHFPDDATRQLALCVLNSSLFYWFYQVRTNCRDFNPSDFRTFPIPDRIDSTGMTALSKKLVVQLDASSTFIQAQHKLTGSIKYEQFKPKMAKPVIDEIDRVLARHYGFTGEELDFIINYDIKYRMGGADGEGEE